MKKIVNLLGIFATVFLLAGLNPNTANAEMTWTYTYTYDNIPSRTVSCVLFGEHSNTLDFNVDGTNYKISSEYKVTDAYCDKFGTVWADLLSDSDILYLGFYNFELQGTEDPVFHIIRIGIVEPSDADWVAIYGADMPNTFWTLPDVAELSHYLSTGEITFNYIPNPYFNSTPVPATAVPVTAEPTPKIDVTTAPTTGAPEQPVSTPEVKVGIMPETEPSSASVVRTSAKPVVKKKQLKSKLQLTYIMGDHSKVITLNKAGILKYKKNVIKQVKDVTFTETGNIIYLKKNGDIYYISGSKIRLLRHKVRVIKKKNNFAIGFKLINGKTIKFKI